MANEPAFPAFAARRMVRVLSICAGIVLCALFVALVVGPTRLDFGKIFRGDDSHRDLFKFASIRLPRALAALVVGGALAVAGAVFQALIHNPLASSYVLGVSAGGSLGAVLAIAAGLTVVVPFAFLGSLAAIWLVYAVARQNGRVPADTLLLAGVVVNAFFSAGIMCVTYTTGSDRTLHIMRWLVGGLSEVNELPTLAGSAVAILSITVLLAGSGRALNLLALGDDVAERLGVAVGTLRTRLFFVGSLLTAIAVSISGPIGFVGLIVPHILSLLIGPDHRLLIPASMLVGGAFLAVADTLASSIYVTPLPVGLVTAFIGGPFFVWLMKSRDRRNSAHGI